MAVTAYVVGGNGGLDRSGYTLTRGGYGRAIVASFNLSDITLPINIYTGQGGASNGSAGGGGGCSAITYGSSGSTNEYALIVAGGGGGREASASGGDASITDSILDSNSNVYNQRANGCGINSPGDTISYYGASAGGYGGGGYGRDGVSGPNNVTIFVGGCGGGWTRTPGSSIAGESIVTNKIFTSQSDIYTNFNSLAANAESYVRSGFKNNGNGYIALEWHYSAFTTTTTTTTIAPPLKSTYLFTGAPQLVPKRSNTSLTAYVVGANGGGGGAGAYVVGSINVPGDLKIYVGGQGQIAPGGGGGGCSAITYVDSNNVENAIIVAAGGSGSSYYGFTECGDPLIISGNTDITGHNGDGEDGGIVPEGQRGGGIGGRGGSSGGGNGGAGGYGGGGSGGNVSGGGGGGWIGGNSTFGGTGMIASNFVTNYSFGLRSNIATPPDLLLPNDPNGYILLVWSNAPPVFTPSLFKNIGKTTILPTDFPPEAMSVTAYVVGGDGGNGRAKPRSAGATIIGSFNLTGSLDLYIGEKGKSSGVFPQKAGGGGGCSAIVDSNGKALIVAGGGGGNSDSISKGLSASNSPLIVANADANKAGHDGASGPQIDVYTGRTGGGIGGAASPFQTGGYGGGGHSAYGGGGGGGWIGGTGGRSGGPQVRDATGGTSMINSSIINSSGFNVTIPAGTPTNGNGYIILTWSAYILL
jgi:hypothetical protein